MGTSFGAYELNHELMKRVTTIFNCTGYHHLFPSLCIGDNHMQNTSSKTLKQLDVLRHTNQGT